MKGVYCVPTNRRLNENFFLFCDEVKHAIQEYDRKISFLVTDDMKTTENYEFIVQIAKQYPEIEFYYFNKESMTKLLSKLIEQMPKSKQDILKSLLPKEEINYGNTLNREFILAMLLNSDMLFRRDSDVWIQNIEGKSLYPIDEEMKYLGKDGNYIIGSGYTGKWGINLDDIVKDGDYTLYADMMCCMNIPRDYVKYIIEDEFIKTAHYEGDWINYQSAAYPQCGNVSFYKMFQGIPCSPAAEIIATDYFLQELCYELEFGIGYHARTVKHRHTKERADQKIKILEYWKRVAMWIDMENVYKGFVKKIEPYKDVTNMEELNHYVLSYMKNLSVENSEMDEMRHNRYMQFVDVMRRVGLPIYNEAANFLIQKEEGIHYFVTQTKYQHEELLEVWPDFVNIIKAQREKKPVKILLREARIS